LHTKDQRERSEKDREKREERFSKTIFKYNSFVSKLFLVG
jgi:hypothetical protein